MASRGEEMLKYQADIRVKTNQQDSTRDSLSDNFTTTTRRLLLLLAAVGLYFPAINKHTDGLCRKTALLVHRLYCLLLVLYLWITFGYGIKDLNEYVRRLPLVMGVMQYASASQTVLTYTIFFWSSFTRRYDNMIAAFDLVFLLDVVPNERRKLKNIVILVIALAIFTLVLSQICIFLTFTLSEWDALDTTTNNTLEEIVPQFSPDLVIAIINYICAGFAIIVPTAFFCVVCYFLSTRFQILNQKIEKKLLVDISENSSDLCHHLLSLRNEHAKICKAVRMADCLFSPVLFLEFTCTISTVCIVLINLLNLEETPIWYLVLSINLLSIIVLVLFSSMVHDKVSNLFDGVLE